MLESRDSKQQSDCWRPGQIVSLWDMVKQFRLLDVADAINQIESLSSQMRVGRQVQALTARVGMDPTISSAMACLLDGAGNSLMGLSLPGVDDLIRELVNYLRTQNPEEDFVRDQIVRILIVLQHESQRARFMYLPSGAVPMLDSNSIPCLIWERLPRCAQGLLEANACLVFERYTACVMHSMCALELSIPRIAQMDRDINRFYKSSKSDDATWGNIVNRLEQRGQALKKQSLSDHKRTHLDVINDLCRLMRAINFSRRIPYVHGKRIATKWIAEETFSSSLSLLSFVASGGKDVK